MLEAGDDEAGAQVAELLLIGLAHRHEGGRIDPENVFLPSSRATPEREHVVHPRAVAAHPALLAWQARADRHVAGSLPQRPVAQQQPNDRECAQPQGDTQHGQDHPDHSGRYSSADSRFGDRAAVDRFAGARLTAGAAATGAGSSCSGVRCWATVTGGNAPWAAATPPASPPRPRRTY